MRYHRLAVRDFAGIRAAEVEPATSGVTIVSGPNERGKSSLLRAIDVLFREPDSSTKAAVRALRPVGRDVGPYVELEFSTGPYRAVYAKQWDVGRRTELRVLEPRPESLTGRDAHDRVRQILDETLDEQLLRALWYEQGLAVTQASLGESLSLQQALDAASGSAVGGDTEATLWQRVRAEWERYFTPGRGQPVGARLELRARLEAAGRTLAEADDALVAVERDADEVAALGEELERLAAQRVALAAEREACQQAWSSVQAIAREVARLRAESEARELERQQAAAAVAGRQALVEAERAAHDALDALDVASGREAPALEQARLGRDAALAEREEARRARQDAAAAVAVANADLQYLQSRRELRLLEQRRLKLTEAEGEGGQAQAFLAECLVSDTALDELRVASEEALRARAAATGDTPRLRIEAVRAVHVDGVEVVAGSVWEAPVAGSLDVSLGAGPSDEMARIRVDAGTAGRRSGGDAQEAEGAFVEACRRYGVDPPTLAAATGLNRRRAAATAAATAAARAIDQALQGYEPAEMDARIGLLRERVERRGGDAPAVDEEDAERAVGRLTAEAAAAEHSARRCEAAAEEADGAYRRLQDEAIGRKTRREAAVAAQEGARSALEGARTQAADDQLVRALATREGAAATARDALGDRQRSLAAADPDATRLFYENAGHALDRTEDERTRLADRRSVLVARLELLGEQGLYDRAASAGAAVVDLRAELDATERRAAAADLLHRVFSEEREAAQRSYVAPYKAELDRLASIVYGAGTTVEVSHDSLRIESRTLGGETVPFDSLSVGAKEQLSALARLAAARLVAPGGGVPVIFDDALGNSDRDRLKRIGALLGELSADLQVIVLTCEPDRYAYVGSAHHVAM